MTYSKEVRLSRRHYAWAAAMGAGACWVTLTAAAGIASADSGPSADTGKSSTAVATGEPSPRTAARVASHRTPAAATAITNYRSALSAKSMGPVATAATTSSRTGTPRRTRLPVLDRTPNDSGSPMAAAASASYQYNLYNNSSWTFGGNADRQTTGPESFENSTGELSWTGGTGSEDYVTVTVGIETYDFGYGTFMSPNPIMIQFNGDFDGAGTMAQYGGPSGYNPFNFAITNPDSDTVNITVTNNLDCTACYAGTPLGADRAEETPSTNTKRQRLGGRRSLSKWDPNTNLINLGPSVRKIGKLPN